MGFISTFKGLANAEFGSVSGENKSYIQYLSELALRKIVQIHLSR